MRRRAAVTVGPVATPPRAQRLRPRATDAGRLNRRRDPARRHCFSFSTPARSVLWQRAYSTRRGEKITVKKKAAKRYRPICWRCWGKETEKKKNNRNIQLSRAISGCVCVFFFFHYAFVVPIHSASTERSSTLKHNIQCTAAVGRGKRSL